MAGKYGRYGKIELGPHPDTVTKRMPLFQDDAVIDCNLNEFILANWLRTQHVPHVIEYTGVRLDRATCDLLVDQRHARHGSLHNFIWGNTASARMRVMRRVFDALLEGMHHLHALGVVHGDLKSGNVVVADDNSDTFDVRIIDFGSCQLYRRCIPRHIKMCTYFYAPPEMFEDNKVQDLPKYDAYSLGAILYELAYRHYCVADGVDSNFIAIRSMHRSGRFKLPTVPPKGLPTDIFEAMRDLLEPDPAKRISITELYHRMHPSTTIAATNLPPTEILPVTTIATSTGCATTTATLTGCATTTATSTGCSPAMATLTGCATTTATSSGCSPATATLTGCATTTGYATTTTTSTGCATPSKKQRWGELSRLQGSCKWAPTWDMACDILERYTVLARRQPDLKEQEACFLIAMSIVSNSIPSRSDVSSRSALMKVLEMLDFTVDCGTPMLASVQMDALIPTSRINIKKRGRED